MRVPRKAAYRAFEEKLGGDPALEWEHYIAEKLSMTVGELRIRMGHDEFVRWQVYYGRKSQQQQQAGWAHR